MTLFSLDFLRLLTYDTLAWYRDYYDTMLNSPATSNPKIRTTYAILNAEIARRIGKEE